MNEQQQKDSWSKLTVIKGPVLTADLPWEGCEMVSMDGRWVQLQMRWTCSTRMAQCYFLNIQMSN